MDLSQPSKENIRFMIEAIKDKLRMVNVDAMKADDFTASEYQDLHDLYKMVARRDSFSPSEMQAIASELGNLRN